MQIFWHGLSCVRIETSQGDTQATLVTDPYGSDTGLRFPRTLAPDVVALSHQDKDRFPLDGFESKPFVIVDPGEYEVKGIFAYAVAVVDAEHGWPHTLLYRFEIEGMSVAFLGGLHRVLNEEELGKLENIDVLLLPVGGHDRLDAKQAIETINAVEPRIVVPLYHQVEGIKQTLGTADAFCKQLGACQRQDGNKLKITKKDLPADDVMVAVLERA